ncbi:FAD binding domain-containing protein [Halohasta litchfieldiae]|jgi:thioredoxin reductase|uniref:FAD binding domain-containing protein n=1 Tax=Halohasta litchfieldiae TaxID=1073996 RepID=A0A1H6SN71_9EURY|nr:FAD-binding protein [Halohasta litchfieldiae]ATW89883.1 FAD binding domain-containing protein [Halohasta litchfieldiae]SEI67354.1 FAD binding domain-containing protein [Halohasta litchfieldiae]
MSDSATDGDRDSYELLVIGGGVAGLTAATFTARAGLTTLVVDHGESILRRNAHLENFPGFPAGVNPRLFADMLHAQATRNGAGYQQGLVDGLFGSLDEGFVATVGAVDDATERREIHAERVLISSWSDVSYLDDLGVDSRDAGSKQYIEDDGLGRTNIKGIYAAGRTAERYHQAVIAAGNGAEAAITLIHDSETPFYNDWVVPEGYFTDRGREVPPGCEEIDAAEQQARQAASRAAMQEYFSEVHEERQRTHPSLVEDEKGRVDWEK